MIDLTRVTRLGEGLHGPEGVVVDRDGAVYGGGEDGVIRRVTPDGRTTEYARTGGRPLGMAFDRAGNLFVCDHGRHAVLVVDPNGRVEVFADRAAGFPIPLPNFCAFDAQGNLYVSSSTGPEEIAPAELLANQRAIGQLFRFTPDGRSRLIADGLEFPNGIAIAPDESSVYVLQSGPWNAVRVPIGPDGEPGAPEVASERFSGLPDGLAFDLAGNAVVTLVMAPRDGRLRGLHRLITLSPDGRTETLVEDPAGTLIYLPTNCAYGGPDLKTLYVASLRGDHVAVVPVEVAGHPLYHQR